MTSDSKMSASDSKSTAGPEREIAELLAQYKAANYALHRRWADAIGTPGYVRDDWATIDVALLSRFGEAAERLGHPALLPQGWEADNPVLMRMRKEHAHVSRIGLEVGARQIAEQRAARERADQPRGDSSDGDVIAPEPDLDPDRMIDDAARALGWRTDWACGGSPVTWDLVVAEIAVLAKTRSVESDVGARQVADQRAGSKKQKAGPISPDDVRDAKTAAIPATVFRLINGLIVRGWNGTESSVTLDAMLALISAEIETPRQTILNNGWLNIEESYQSAGWDVSREASPDLDCSVTRFIFRKR